MTFKDLLIVTLVVAMSGIVPSTSAWWQNAIFYQIYPRSFMDSNGDGVGDLRGIISRLGHIKDAGVTAAWLSPIYKSPQVDAGYDISDYKAIHAEYGTMEDFEELMAKAKELGLKIIMDMVPNHSSDQHEWFIKSEKRIAGFEDYYVWRDGPNGDDITPPNNWISLFKYSAWKYSTVRGQWYLHQFADAQPDLNFENPKVMQEMLDVMQFWMDKGVYGFRVDAVPHISESQGFEDEPPSGNPNVEDYEHDSLLHHYTKDMPGSYDVVYNMRAFIDEYNQQHANEDDRIMMTEAYANITATMLWYGNGEREGAQFTFNFQLIPINKDFTAADIVGKVTEWMDNMPAGRVANWVIGNHDNHRIASRADPANVDGFNMFIHMLPGIAVTYQGEEIGMQDGEVAWEQGQDPSACNGPPEKFNATSRDFERTPFHWDATKNAGFSTADETWLPVSSKYVENNLQKQMGEENSHYKIYQALTALRRDSDVMKQGKMEITSKNNVLLLRRYMDNGSANEHNHVFMFNLGDSSETIDLLDIFPSVKDLAVVISTTNNSKHTIKSLKQFNLAGHAAIIGVEQ